MSDERRNTERMIDALAQDARVREEARMLPKDRELTLEEIGEIRRRAAFCFEGKEIPASQVAKHIGRAPSCVTSFLLGNYKGDNDKVARLLHAYVDHVESGADPARPREYVSTAVAERIIGVMKHSHRTRTIGVVYGPAGVGKSIAAQAAMTLIPGSVYVPCLESMGNLGGFLNAWCRALGMKGRSTNYDMHQSIIERLRGSDRLQLFDDVQYLSSRAFNCIRDVQKLADVGVTMFGTTDAEKRLDDFESQYGQMERLRSGTYDILEESQETGRPLFTPDEVAAFAQSMQLRITPGAIERLTDLASEPGWGGLGGVRVLLANAEIAMRKTRASVIDVKHLALGEQVRRGFSGARRAAHRIEARARKAKVA